MELLWDAPRNSLTARAHLVRMVVRVRNHGEHTSVNVLWVGAVKIAVKVRNVYFHYS